MHSLVDLVIVGLSGSIWLGIVGGLRLRKNKDITYLIFFSILYVYIVAVLNYTLFQFQSLLILRYFMPGLLLQGLSAEESLNLIPLFGLTSGDLMTSLLNILLFMPFGFGLPFLADLRWRKVIISGMFFSLLIEAVQLLSGRWGDVTFRIADINDVIFNTIGVAVGYVLFILFINLFKRLPRSYTEVNPLLHYIAERSRER